MSHHAQCDKVWKWPDFMGGRGIERKDCWMCGLLDEARAAALRDAVKAVQSQLTDDPNCSGTNWNNALFCAEEAIEALRGEQ
jgi:hypothetical protein